MSEGPKLYFVVQCHPHVCMLDNAENLQDASPSRLAMLARTEHHFVCCSELMTQPSFLAHLKHPNREDLRGQAPTVQFPRSLLCLQWILCKPLQVCSHRIFPILVVFDAPLSIMPLLVSIRVLSRSQACSKATQYLAISTQCTCPPLYRRLRRLPTALALRDADCSVTKPRAHQGGA